MLKQRTRLLLFFILIIGTILQGIGLFTPRWRIGSPTFSNDHIEQGLWCQTECVLGKCTSKTFYEIYKAAGENYKASAGVTYAERVGKQTMGVLSLFCCLVSSVLTFLIYRNHAHKERMSLLVTCLLLVAGSLIWTINGETIAITISFSRTIDHSIGVIKFPYSLFLSSLGSVLSIIVALVNFCTAWRDKQPSLSNDNVHLRPFTEYPMQTNVQNNRPQQSAVTRQNYSAYPGPYTEYPMQINEDQNRPQLSAKQHGGAYSRPYDPMQMNEERKGIQQSARQHSGAYTGPYTQYPMQMNEERNGPKEAVRHGGAYSGPYSEITMQMNEERYCPQQPARQRGGAYSGPYY